MSLSIPEILSTTRLFGGLAPEDLARIGPEFEPIRVPGGETVFEHGETGDCLYIVASGRIEVSLTLPDGSLRPIGEAGPGECLGEMALLTGERRSATARSRRDTDLLRLSGEAFRRLLETHPRLMYGLTRRIIGHYQSVLSGRRGASAGRISTIAVATTQKDGRVAEFTRRLVEALGRHGSVRHLDASALDSALGEGSAQAARDSSRNSGIVAYLNEQEEAHRFVVYEAEPGPSSWTSRCLRQADRILFVAPDDGSPAPGPIEALLARQGLADVRTADLVLLHRETKPLYLGTSAWLAPRRVRAHHHVAESAPGEMERLVRSLTGEVRGLVLGGGGARSFAQIGVLRALAERGVSFDVVGGTSMGAFLGAQVAMGWDPGKMLAFNEVTWTRTKPLKDYTFPYLGFVTGRRFYSVARAIYGEARLEDLRIPFFCCSSNLTRARVEVHDAGPAWRALGASIAVPGLAPPAFEGGDLLVDGAVLANLPVDVMRGRCSGTVVTIDVSPVEDLSVDPALTMAPNSWGLLFRKLLGKKAQVPGFFELLMRSSGLASVQQVGEMQRLSDVFFHPPIEKFSIFDFSLIRDLERIGYEHAVELLAGPAGELLAERPASAADAPASSGGGAKGGEPLPRVLEVGEVTRARKDEDA